MLCLSGFELYSRWVQYELTRLSLFGFHFNDIHLSSNMRKQLYPEDSLVLNDLVTDKVKGFNNNFIYHSANGYRIIFLHHLLRKHRGKRNY